MEITNLVEKDQFAKYCGIELTEVATGTATAKMVIHPHHLNGVGIVQGGALFTLADVALAAAANSHNVVAVGLVSSINYFKAEASGTLYAKANEISLRRTIACYHVDIINEQNELIAAFQGTVYRKNG